MNTYTIEKSETKNTYVLFDSLLNMAVAAGTYKEMFKLRASLDFEAPEIME